MPPRACPAPDRPPVESCTIMPGQCLFNPSISRAKRSGSEVGFALIIADMAMGDGGPGLEGLLRGLHLFGDA